MGECSSGINSHRPHSLAHLINESANKMAAEYERMRETARKDPGTSGDQGEENWADLLKDWLPTPFHVRTKGRVVFPDGRTSDQVDVVILSPYYPKGLLSDKLYIAAGVLAAFECKRTLLRPHFQKAVQSAVKLGELSRSAGPSQHHIIYGILAHSHQIACKRQPAAVNLESALMLADEKFIADPRDCLDFVCVPTIGTWSIMRFYGSLGQSEPRVMTSYMEPALN